MASDPKDQEIQRIYVHLRSKTGASVDVILIRSNLRHRYLDLVEESLGPVDEEQAMSRLLSLRKRGKVPRGKLPQG